jgi:hypothetical protein
MNDLLKRMSATINFGIITNDDTFERAIAESQFREAIKYIEILETERDKVILWKRNVRDGRCFEAPFEFTSECDINNPCPNCRDLKNDK